MENIDYKLLRADINEALSSISTKYNIRSLIVNEIKNKKKSLEIKLISDPYLTEEYKKEIDEFCKLNDLPLDTYDKCFVYQKNKYHVHSINSKEKKPIKLIRLKDGFVLNCTVDMFKIYSNEKPKNKKL